MQLFAEKWITFFKGGATTLANGSTLKGGFFAGGPAIAPAYLGVGYIIGPRLASLSFSGLLLAWGLMVPIILAILGPTFVEGLKANAGSAESTGAWLNAADVVWREYVRIIAIGGMLVAACFTLYRMRASLGAGLKRAWH